MGKVVNEHAAALGQLGGQQTARKLSPQRRSENASKAGRAAWKGLTKLQRSDIMKRRARVWAKRREAQS